MAGYTRQSAGSIVNGGIIDADDFNDEYNAIEAAFNASTGHTHDGTTGNGPPIENVGPSADLVVTATEVRPKLNNTLDLGTAAVQFKNGYFDGQVNTDTLLVDETSVFVGDATFQSNATVEGNLTVDGVTTLNGATVVGDAATDIVTFNAYVDSGIYPNVTGTYDLGSASNEWNNIWIDGQAQIDDLVADTADINAGTIDDTVIGGTTPNAGSFTTLDATSGITGDLTGDVTGDVTGNLTGNVTGGTIDGIIGSVTPAAADFTTVDVSGATTLAGTLNVTGDTTVENLIVNGTTTLGNAGGDVILFNGTVSSNFTPNITATYTLGTPSNVWSNVYADAVTVSTNINVGGDLVVTGDLTVQGTTTTVNSTTVDIADLNITLASNATTPVAANGGGITVAGAAATMTYVSTTDRWAMNKDLAVANIYADIKASDGTTVFTAGDGVTAAAFTGTVDGVIGGTNPAAVTGTTIQFDTGLTDGTITIDGFVDEDDMVSDSATKVPTQQSVKAYVDNSLSSGSGSIAATDLSVTTSGGLDFNGGAATGWVVAQNSVSNDLEFIYNGVVQFKMTSTGTLNANDDIVAAAF